ncbi:thioredoxin [Kiritimatiella glycovorans]|uniref:Thioredoxin n=1 Tax=Kiritimatiella glycovorans TaxID=1307763 RepID=A0A0G3EDU5_9BACT|nr:thioredoxin [Kiritimatiella glycovorans]AKJ63587.1 Thioredoxin-1 [Kiritimatiella glycovorans]
MSEGIKDLNGENFDQAVNSGVALVDFWAPWCGPCKMQTPILESLADKVGDEVTLAKVNVDEGPEIAARYGVRSIPTLIVFKDGEVAQQFVGVKQEAELKQAIESAQ